MGQTDPWNTLYADKHVSDTIVPKAGGPITGPLVLETDPAGGIDLKSQNTVFD